MYLAPSSFNLLSIETQMAGYSDNKTLLKKSLSDIETYFDYIFLDLPHGIPLLMINGLVASEDIIIPLDAGVFAYEAMDTLKTLVVSVDKEFGVQTNVITVLLRECSADFIDKLQMRDIKILLKKFIGTNLIGGVKIFCIPFSIKVCLAQKKGLPISHFAPFSKVGKIYKKIAQYIAQNE